jgi:hypothetical protein
MKFNSNPLYSVRGHQYTATKFFQSEDSRDWEDDSDFDRSEMIHQRFKPNLNR